MGNSALRVALAAAEYTCNLSSPSWIINGPDLTIRSSCNGISIVNDIPSARKELAETAVDGLLPIAYALTRNAQDSADIATHLIEHDADVFYHASKRLLSSCEDDLGLPRELQSMFLGSQYYCTENLERRHDDTTATRESELIYLVNGLTTPRYKAATRIQKDAMYIAL